MEAEDFIALDMLSEELAACQYYLETTPVSPFTNAEEHRLPEKKDHLHQTIEHLRHHNNSEECEDRGGKSTSTSLTPEFTPQLSDLSNAYCTSISGFSTPDLFANQHKTPFASVAEEPFPNEDSRMAQELM
jgi:hypothetical protein